MEKYIKTLPLSLFAAGVLLSSCDSDVAVSQKPETARDSFDGIVIFNEDNDRFFIYNQEMSEEALDSHIDNIAGGNITHYFMCPNGQRTSYDSKVHEPIWAPIDGKEPAEKWAVNCKLLRDRNIDPYSVWIRACRKRGISPWISMRMNDVHFATTPNCFRNQKFWRERPDLWRVPQKTLPTKGDWNDYAFNYKHKEVRDFQLALVKELFERYDFDGFELDWMRFGKHLTPGKETAEACYITEFIREVKKISDAYASRRGHKIGISARVHVTPEIALKNGLDCAEWAREKLVDIIVPSCMYISGDFDISVSDWRKYLGADAKHVAVIPSTDNGFTPSFKVKRRPITLALLYGWATAMRSNGADSLYVFNAFYQRKIVEEVRQHGLSESVARDGGRRHPVTYHHPDTVQLPVLLDKARDIKIVFGEIPSIPARGELSAVVAFADKDINPDGVSVKLNGHSSLSRSEVGNPKDFGNAARAVRFFFDYNALVGGRETLRVESLWGKPYNLIWCELDTTPAQPPRP